ncbi:non-specific lipid transfer protein GPI-anchored 2 isoform X2 [Vigna radiata var. radiata]|uniref:Non-specific lipid transfer protein GPI-anchored 2 isoform X2 n=1 Tax=Vigna radiata var. radiata TaxID=3916 RepID=A0A1S3TPE7_VIGRR|nr:non-specific lipid transfer protein GPI-anchored 2 isoform X2 [Vigna radiata var. radiata]
MLSSLMAFQIGVILTAFMVGLISSVSGQVSTSCTTSMMNSITPCANIITGSTNNNGLKPPSTCCDSLRSLMNTNTNCACFLLSANAPFFQLPLTLALSFSQACNINGLPLQCKASASPLPAPGPAVLPSNGPTLSPLSPPDSKMVEEEKYQKIQLAAASSPAEAEAPSRSRIPQIRPVLTPLPSPSRSSFLSSPPYAFLVGIVLLCLYS